MQHVEPLHLAPLPGILEEARHRVHGAPVGPSLLVGEPVHTPFPLLLLSAALLARPAGSSYLHRAALSLLGPAVYVAWTYAKQSSLDKVYNLPTSSVAGLVGGVLLAGLYPRVSNEQ